MSVVKSKRHDGLLAVITKANELAVYTIKICSNEKSFPKHYRWCITAKIVALTQGIKFLGFKFRLTETGKVIKTLSKENIAHERRKLRKQRHLAEEGRMTKWQCDECYTSWKAHAERGNTHNLILEMDKFYKELWRNYENVQPQDRTPAT